MALNVSEIHNVWVLNWRIFSDRNLQIIVSVSVHVRLLTSEWVCVSSDFIVIEEEVEVVLPIWSYCCDNLYSSIYIFIT